MKYLFFITIFSLSIFACGRDEILDKSLIETALIENPYDNDLQPLSSYHGELKADILLAKTTAEAMGVKFPKIYVRSGTKGTSLGECKAYKWGKSIILLSDEIKNSVSSLSAQQKFLLLTQVMIHEWVHCNLNFLDHDADGVMTAGVNKEILSWNEQYQLYQKLNDDHGANLNLEAFNSSFIKIFSPENYAGQTGESSIQETEIVYIISYVSLFDQGLKLKKTETITTHHENFVMPELYSESKKLYQIDSDVLNIMQAKNYVFKNNDKFQLVTASIISDVTSISSGKRTIYIHEQHSLPLAQR